MSDKTTQQKTTRAAGFGCNHAGRFRYRYDSADAATYKKTIEIFHRPDLARNGWVCEIITAYWIMTVRDKPTGIYDLVSVNNTATPSAQQDSYTLLQ
mmetsp:Transcript_92787/g.188994  ORF Transcript_92787/g.188994 Transcript_92787/m.188994 type:complete len:97 (+) Transcript_92787:401-691(+)